MFLEKFCFTYANPITDCPCASFIESAGNCVIDLSDDAIYGIFVLGIVISVISHFIMLVWTIYLLGRSVWKQSLKKAFTPNVGKVIFIYSLHFFLISKQKK